MGAKFAIFALFYFVFESKFQVQAPQGAYIRRGDLTEGLYMERFIFGILRYVSLSYQKNKFPYAAYIFRMNSLSVKLK